MQERTWVRTEEELESRFGQTVLRRYVTNISDITLNKVQLEALSLAFKFSAPCPKVSRIDVESHFEYLYSQSVDQQTSKKDNVS